MPEFSELKSRVESAVEAMSAAQETRQQEKQSFLGLLSGLEEKFAARDQELEYCRQRIDELTAANGELSELISQLVETAERYCGAASDEPVYQAAAMASDMLDRWSGDDVENVADDVSAGVPAAAAADGVTASTMQFDDVSPEELAAEDAEDLAAQVDDAVAEAAAPNLPEEASPAIDAPPAMDPATDDAVAPDAGPNMTPLDEISPDVASMIDDQAAEQVRQALEADSVPDNQAGAPEAEEKSDVTEYIDIYDADDDVAEVDIVDSADDVEQPQEVAPTMPTAEEVAEAVMGSADDAASDDGDHSIQAMLQRLEEAAQRVGGPSEDGADSTEQDADPKSEVA